MVKCKVYLVYNPDSLPIGAMGPYASGDHKLEKNKNVNKVWVFVENMR